MTSFTHQHRMYLFEMTTGKQKLAYGRDRADAFEVLGYRLTDDEMAQIIPDKWTRISARDIQKFVTELG